MMRKAQRLLAVLFVCILVLTTGTVALADKIEGEVISLGADLNEAQKATVLKLMGLEGVDITAITVTNQDEKDLLGNFVPAEKIGTRAISSAYVKRGAAGEGIKVTTFNINWCSSAMYASAVTTAGITDAEICVAAPFEVSGTAALAGILKAYETAANVTLSEEAKDVASEELVTTGELAEFLGSDQAAGLISELKKQIAEQNLDNPETIRAAIIQITADLNVTLTEAQIQSLIDLAIRLSKLDLDPAKLEQQLKSFADTLQKLEDTQKKAEGAMASIQAFFTRIANWFSGLFGKK